MQPIFEELTPLHFDPLLGASPIFRRLTTEGGRYYYSGEKPEVQIYRSVTTALHQGMPKEYGLEVYIANQGSHEAHVYNLRIAADYGTFMHACIQDYLLHQINPNIAQIDVEDIVYTQLQAFKHSGRYLIDSEGRWFDDSMSDVYALDQFYHERNVRVLAIEPILGIPDWFYGKGETICPLAGAIDMVLEMDFNKKRVRSIVDNKSGHKGTYDNYIAQIMIYRKIWNYNYPDFQVTSIFNWQPKEWRGASPTYTLTNQIDKLHSKVVDNAIENSFLMNPLKEPTRKRFNPIPKGEEADRSKLVELIKFNDV